MPNRTAASHDRISGISNALLAVLIWAGWMVFSSQAVHGSLTAFDVTALRFGTAAIVMFPVLLKRGFKVGPWGIGSAILMALTMGATYNTIAIYGMKFASTAHASLLQSVMLLLTTIGGVVLLKEKTSPLRLVGIVLSLVGIGILLASHPNGAHPQQVLGHALFIIGAALWAFYALLVRAWKPDPLHATAAICFYSALFFLPIYFLFLPRQISLENWHAAAFQAGYQGIINSVFAVTAFNRAIVKLGAGTASAFLPLIPVLAALAAIPLLHEITSPQEWLGIGFASLGVLLSTGMAGRWFSKEKAIAVEAGL